MGTYLQFGTRFCGIEHISENGQDRLFITLLKKNKKEVNIESSFDAVTIVELTNQLPKKQHAVLIINNESVLTKKIESDQTEDLKLVYKAFPNIKLEDFYHEVLTQASIHFVSICRKLYVEQLITQYNNQGIYIINVSLGSIIAYSTTKYIDSKTISTSNAFISLQDNSILNIEKVTNIEQKDYDINGVNVSNKHLLSFSGALTSILNNYQSHTNFDAHKKLLLSEFKQSRFFSQFLKFGLVFLLGILLINFFVFNHYFNNVNTLQQTSQFKQITKNKVLELNEKVAKTQKMVQDMLQSNSSKSSYYINTIIQSLPTSILLSELNYQPLLKRIKVKQPIQNEIHTILISGTSARSETFSNWIASLDSFGWINKVEILSYQDISKSKSDFSIKLNITNDD